MTLWRTYYLAKSVTEAVQLLGELPGSGRIVAGGTDLLLDLQQKRHPPVDWLPHWRHASGMAHSQPEADWLPHWRHASGMAHSQPEADWLVDVTAIPELNRLEACDNGLFVGAAVPLNRIVESALVKRHAYALYQACSLIGGPQVRNVATLGGNVGHALPAGDGTIALLALDAKAEIAANNGRQLVPLAELFLGPGRSALQPGQLLVGFHLPLCNPTEGSAFQRVMRPQGVAIAILNMAAWVHCDRDVLLDLRLSIGPAGPVPLRPRKVEAFLRGKPYSPEALEQASRMLLAEVHFRTSPHRASAAYRRWLGGVLLIQTLQEAILRARANVR